MNPSDGLTVSVVIPNYNCAPFLGATISSVLAQSPEPEEVIVVDDGSTDDSRGIAGGFGGRVQLVALPPSGRPSVPRNVGLRRARGDLVAILDADDLMLPGKLACAREVFGGSPDVALLFTDFRLIDERGGVLQPSFLVEYRDFRASFSRAAPGGALLAEGRDAYRCLLRSNFIGTSSVVARRNALLALGGFDESLTNSDDVDLWYRLTRAGGKIAFVDDVFHEYRVRSGSISSRGSGRWPPVIRVLRDQLPFVTDAADRALLQGRISECTLEHAHQLRIEGHPGTAARMCLGELRLRPSWRGLRQLLRAIPPWLLATATGRR